MKINPKYLRDAALAEELAPLALAGDLDVACLLGVIEAPYPLVTNLDANPDAAAAYMAARAVEMRRLHDEWHEHADRVAHALL
jgi:hypothetical protein